MSTETTDERRQRRARAITDALPAPEGIRDDWGGFIIDAVQDGVWARGTLTQPERSMITIAALCALHGPNELEIHIQRGLRDGLSREQISEIIMHMAIYGGFPVAVEGMHTAKDVFDAETD